MQIDENNKFNKVCSILSIQRDDWRCSLFGRSQRPPITETTGSAIRHISPYYLPSYVNSVSRHIYHTPYNIQWFCVRTNYGREVFNGKYISITLNFPKTRWLKLPGGVVLIFNVRCEGYIYQPNWPNQNRLSAAAVAVATGVSARGTWMLQSFSRPARTGTTHSLPCPLIDNAQTFNIYMCSVPVPHPPAHLPASGFHRSYK